MLPCRAAKVFLTIALGTAIPGRAAAHEGWGIVVDAAGRVFVADIPANTIWRITPNGTMERIRRGIHSHALNVGPDGSVYGSHTSLTDPVRGVWRLSPDGQWSDIIPATPNFPLGLQSFLFGPNGSVYSASPYQNPAPATGQKLYLMRWSPGGAVDTIAGGSTGIADGSGQQAQFQAIDGMSWLPDGAILIADGARLRRVNPDGSVRSLGHPITSSNWDEDLLGVAVGPDSSIYAADFAGRVVYRVVGDNRAALYSRTLYWSASGVAADREAVYVLEHPRAPLGILGDLGVGPYMRVRKLYRDGRVDTLAVQWGRNSLVFLMVLIALIALPFLIKALRKLIALRPGVDSAAARSTK